MYSGSRGLLSLVSCDERLTCTRLPAERSHLPGRRDRDRAISETDSELEFLPRNCTSPTFGLFSFLLNNEQMPTDKIVEMRELECFFCFFCFFCCQICCLLHDSKTVTSVLCTSLLHMCLLLPDSTSTQLLRSLLRPLLWSLFGSLSPTKHAVAAQILIESHSPRLLKE